MYVYICMYGAEMARVILFISRRFLSLTQLLLLQFICDHFLIMQCFSNLGMRLLLFDFEVERGVFFLIVLDVMSFASLERCPNVLPPHPLYTKRSRNRYML